MGARDSSKSAKAAELGPSGQPFSIFCKQTNALKVLGEKLEKA